MESETNNEAIDRILEGIEYFAVAIELLAVAVIVVGVLAGTATYLSQRRRGRARMLAERTYRENLGHALLLGLEILVAADIVRTVALEPSLESVAVLGILVLIRTLLSWSIAVEVEGTWPWRLGRTSHATSSDRAATSEPEEAG